MTTTTGPQAQEAGGDHTTMLAMVDAFRKAHDEHAAAKIAKVYAKGQREDANVIVGLRAALEVMGKKAHPPARVVSDADVERALSAEVGGEIVLSFLTTQDNVTAEQIMRAALSTLQSGAEGKDGEEIARILPPYTELDLRQQIAGLHREYTMRIQPFVNALVKIEAMKPPRPFFLHDLEPKDTALQPGKGEG